MSIKIMEKTTNESNYCVMITWLKEPLTKLPRSYLREDWNGLQGTRWLILASLSQRHSQQPPWSVSWLVLQWGGRVFWINAFFYHKPFPSWHFLTFSFIKWQSKPNYETKKLYSFTGDYGNNTQMLSDLKRLPFYQNYREILSMEKTTKLPCYTLLCFTLLCFTLLEFALLGFTLLCFSWNFLALLCFASTRARSGIASLAATMTILKDCQTKALPSSCRWSLWRIWWVIKISNKLTETECPWLTTQILASGPELSSSNLIIACLLCHNQNLTLDLWDFVFSHSRRQRTWFDLYSSIVLSNVTNMAEQLDGFTQDPRSHLSHLISYALSNIQYTVQLRLWRLQSYYTN